MVMWIDQLIWVRLSETGHCWGCGSVMRLAVLHRCLRGKCDKALLDEQQLPRIGLCGKPAVGGVKTSLC